MPKNRGRGQQSTRWYKLCFVPKISTDSSDDSDTESVILAPASTSTSTSTWQQLSPPHPPPPPPPPPNPEPQINWTLFPPPPPSFFPPSPSLQARAAELDMESLYDSTGDEQPFPPHDSPPPPLPPLPSEHQINPTFLSPPRSPPFYPPAELDIESLDESSGGEFSTPYPSPPPPFYIESRHHHSPTRDAFVSPYQNERLQDPADDVLLNALQWVRIKELNVRGDNDKLTQCPICMEEFEVGDEACRLPCNHTYRPECILRWLNNNNSCPLCRLHLDCC